MALLPAHLAVFGSRSGCGELLKAAVTLLKTAYAQRVQAFCTAYRARCIGISLVAPSLLLSSPCHGLTFMCDVRSPSKRAKLEPLADVHIPEVVPGQEVLM